MVGNLRASAGNTGSVFGLGRLPHMPWGSEADAPQLLNSTHLELVLYDRRSHYSEKPAHRKERGSPTRCKEEPAQPKINK